MISESIAVNDVTATKIITSVNMHQQVYIHNEHGSSIYLGGSNVTINSGFELSNNASTTMRIPQDNELYCIGSSASGNVIVVRPD